jgi:hypothetical protein
MVVPYPIHQARNVRRFVFSIPPLFAPVAGGLLSCDVVDADFTRSAVA